MSSTMEQLIQAAGLGLIEKAMASRRGKRHVFLLFLLKLSKEV